MSLLKGDGFFDPFTPSICLDSFRIFPDDTRAGISLFGSGIMINGQHPWLALQTREKLVQKGFHLLSCSRVALLVVIVKNLLVPLVPY